MQEINTLLLQFLNKFGENTFVQIFVKIFVDAPIFIIPVFLLGYWLYYSYFLKENVEFKNKLILITYGIIIGLFISLIIQKIITVDRPESVLSTKNLLMKHLPDASFPSDHATVGMAFLFGILFAGYKKWFLILVLPFTFMIISRVIAGVHWPFDIIGGTLVGLFSAKLTFSKIYKIEFIKKANLKIIKILKYIKL